MLPLFTFSVTIPATCAHKLTESLVFTPDNPVAELLTFCSTLVAGMYLHSANSTTRVQGFGRQPVTAPLLKHMAYVPQAKHRKAMLAC